MDDAADQLLPHPVTGELFASPVSPGTGWPSDPASLETPAARGPAQVRRLAAASETTEQLAAEISVCRACPRLVRWREKVAVEKRAAFAGEPYWGRPVPSFGDPEPYLLVVGLAPAAHGGNRTGRMFTGDRSGDWLFAALHRAGFASQAESNNALDGLTLTGARCISPVHCAPPDNKPTTTEKHTCSAWFDRELQLAEHATGIVALGGFAWQAVLAAGARLGWEIPKPRPKFGHGLQVVMYPQQREPVTLVGCYHVSQHNTFTGRLTETMLDEIFARFY
ncbi:uracil-DNA glycosylase [Micrococcoides hystricis]|uniref:Type-5 uracil-DNA glycosylase n=1 Tax=Micrococcoides hystricis TaxID=1572761 RepID=A0ABV6PAJ6_9MICC